MIKSLYPFARKWSEKGSVWLYSDPHFDDEDCLLINPSWPEPAEQIKNLKYHVHKNDTLVILGDIGNPEYLRGIKAYKVLIAGNHDSGLSKYEEYFDEVYKGPLFISDKILLSHEPFENIPPYVFNIHGHVHNGVMLSIDVDEEGKTLFQKTSRMNVAADVVGFMPVNLGKFIKDGWMAKIPSIHRYTIDYQRNRTEDTDEE